MLYDACEARSVTGITVTRVEDRLVAVKPADPPGAERRRREAALLARLDHPGIVHYLDLVEGASVELHMDYAGTDTWDRSPPTTAAAIIDGLAAVAATVADLHDLGTTHGALRSEHVIVGADRRPVLCGLADATPADAAGRAHDLAALADLVADIGHGGPDNLRAALDDIATEARSGGLTARQLAARLTRLEQAPRPGDRIGRRVARLSARSSAIGAGTIALVSLGVWLWPSGTDPATSAPTRPRLAVVTTTSGDPPTTTAPTTTASIPAPPALVASGGVFEHDGRRYALGSADDVVVLGDWDCDGSATPAVLVAASGDVARFERWPEPGGEVTATAIVHEPTATGLEVVATEACDRLRIIRPSGSSFFPEQP